MSKASTIVALFVDQSTTGTPSWLRVGKATTFTLNYNPETEDKDYIEDETKTTEIKSYAPSMDEDIAIDKTYPEYVYFNGIRKKLPTGTDAHLKYLTVYLNDGDNELGYYAEQQEAVTSITDFNAVDGLLDINIAYCGTRTVGKVTMADGVPTFTAD